VWRKLARSLVRNAKREAPLKLGGQPVCVFGEGLCERVEAGAARIREKGASANASISKVSGLCGGGEGLCRRCVEEAGA
jgi:hypothetical protein